MAILTDARLSLWQAIDNSPLLLDASKPTGVVFNSTIRGDGKMPLIRGFAPSAPGQLPCLAIQPTTIDPQWFTHEMMRFSLLLQCTLWTKDEWWDEPEDLIERIWKAIYRTCPPDQPGVSYVKAATGYHPRRLGPIQFQPATIGDGGKVVVVKTTMTIGLQPQQDPFAD